MSRELDVQKSEATKKQVLDVIKHAINHHPRSLQTAIGPSEVGIECDRRIGYKLAGVPEVNDGGDKWLPTIGTGVHAWLADAFEAENKRLERQRYLVEHRIEIPVPGGNRLGGSLDLYDIDEGNVIDHKIVGKTTLDKARAQGPSEQYRTQLNTYGLGLYFAGYEPKTITINYLPRNGTLRQAVVHSEPYNGELAAAAIERVSNIRFAIDLQGPQALPLLKAVEANCNYCPFHRLNATDLTVACPGPGGAKTSEQIMSDLLS